MLADAAPCPILFALRAQTIDRPAVGAVPVLGLRAWCAFRGYFTNLRNMARRESRTSSVSQASRMGTAHHWKGKPNVRVRTSEFTAVSGKNQATIWRACGRRSIG